MTETTKIEKLGRMMDNDMDEELLSDYLEMAGYKILNRMYPYLEEYEGLKVPDRYANIQLNIACYMLNKIGAEGQIQHIENGIHRNYGDADVPDAMLRDVVPYAMVIR